MTFILLCGLTFALAVFALSRRRLLWGVIGVGAHSLALAGVYLFLAAPDVALTEAAVGFALVTFVYLLAIRRTGRLAVVATELRPLLYAEGDGVAGLQWDILQAFGRWTHRDVEVEWVARSDIPDLLASGEAELGAGGVLLGKVDGALQATRELVPTKLVILTHPGRQGPLAAVRGDRAADFLDRADHRVDGADQLLPSVDRGDVRGLIVNALQLWAWRLQGMGKELEAEPLEDDLAFSFVVAADNDEVRVSLEAFLEEFAASGELDRLLRRYLR